MIEWRIQGESYSSCNCDHACPCQFEGLPNQGFCAAVEGFVVNQGHFGDIDLGGTKAAVLYAWPGPVFEGRGEMQIVIDSGASAAQRDALEQILTGQHCEEASNHWWVFHAMSDTVHETLVRPIRFTTDMETRKARLSIEDVVDSTGEPIRNSFDGGEHRVRIQCPDGIEFHTAEIGNGVTRADGPIKLEFANTYAQFCMIDHSHEGPAHRTRQSA